ncbi:putative ABC transporter permease YknZ [Luteitalea pratensis]|uniref:Putative ABC transporter permease YknZ n=1 Tax=Luteitalea pratensis TaxID=1855912 RepID=A0A143PSQ9_LUTPR|nr:ABC transporter permease [Luteitalea pratensis]AMY11193.1 putative ABC transporter permease YknZ [Luteitalea pratensis]
MNLRSWSLRARAMFARSRVERELDEELAFHIDREVQKLIDEGVPEADARVAARRRFGSMPGIADECRDARGINAIDNIVRDTRYALRGFARAPLVSLTIIATVGLGLGLVAAAFTFLSTFLFRVDRVPDIHEMFAVERARTGGDPSPPFTRGQFDALARDTRVFTGTYAEFADLDSHVEGRTMTGSLVTGNFFQVLGVHAAMGRALTQSDDEPLAGRQVMVLSHRGWERMFARDPAILGRELLVNGLTFQIVGVMPEGFRGLMVGPPDYWAPLSLLGQLLPAHRDRPSEAGVGIIGRLRPGLTPQQARAELAVWDGAQEARDPNEKGVSDVVLTPRRGTVPQPLEAVIVTAPLFFAFGLILLIGCANVTNLLLARGVARQREIGIRLSIGATRRRIVFQLLTESLLLALVAAAAGYVISRVVLRGIINGVMTSIPSAIGDVRLRVPDADWRVLLFLVIGAVLSTAFFGLTPALQATRIEPVRTIRGEVTRDTRPGRARSFLIGLQVSASALLLICAAVFLRSTFTAAIESPGVRISDIVVVRVSSEEARMAMVQAVSDEPSVAAIAASWPSALSTGPRVVAETDTGKTTLPCQFVSPEYFGLLGIEVLQGRGFMPAERSSNLSVAVVSEATARRLWPTGQAVGQVLRLDRDTGAGVITPGEPVLESRTVTVVGVVKDVAGFRIAPLEAAVVYVPTSAAMPGTSLIARVHGDATRAQESLVTRLSAIDPNMANRGQVGAMVWVTRMVTYFLWLAFWLTVVLGALALALTLSGLFGVLSYLVERRSREIGIRMALGAAASDVTRLVLLQTIRPVGIGLAIGALAAAGLAVLLLASPAAAGLGGIVRVLDPVSYAAAGVVIVAACLAAAAIPAARAARLNPTAALRQE